MLGFRALSSRQSLIFIGWILALACFSRTAVGAVTVGEQRQVDTIAQGSTDTTGGGKFIGSDGSSHFYVCWTEHPMTGNPRILCRTYDQNGGELVQPQRVDTTPMASAAT